MDRSRGSSRAQSVRLLRDEQERCLDGVAMLLCVLEPREEPLREMIRELSVKNALARLVLRIVTDALGGGAAAERAARGREEDDERVLACWKLAMERHGHPTTEPRQERDVFGTAAWTRAVADDIYAQINKFDDDAARVRPGGARGEPGARDDDAGAAAARAGQGDGGV